MSKFWIEQSNELGVVCDAAGVIVDADERAVKGLGLKIGDSLMRAVLPGMERRLTDLLTKAAANEVTGWELPLIRYGTSCTMVVHAKTVEPNRIAMLAACVPDKYTRAIDELSATMTESVTLNREIAKQKSELESAYRSLDDSHRGVLTLHEELEDQAAVLKRTADVKGRVVANVSHEFRTPLHSILGLSKLLLDGVDGALNEEQRKQVRYIRGSAEELNELVTDMLDLSKAESGRAQVRPVKFTASDFASSMRGVMLPLVPENHPVALTFEVPEDFEIETDQSKVGQIVRNLVSNALKFTEQGSIRTVVRKNEHDELVVTVTDTGIGIAPEHHAEIFEEFGQIENAIQARVKGTGLGLALSRKLAVLLGGSLTVTSAAGEGAVFTLTLPLMHPDQADFVAIQSRPVDPERSQILVLEDDRTTIFVYEKYLTLAGYQVLPARTVDEARAILATHRPAAIVLDVMLERETTWKFLSDLKHNPETHDIPTLVVTVTAQQQKARALGADEFWLKPIDQERLIRKLRSFDKPSGGAARLLMIDDDEKFLYFTRKLLDKTPYFISEATNGKDGVRLAQEDRPDVIFLDFLLREMTAFDVLDELKSDPRTRSIPVIVVTSHVLDGEELARLARDTEGVVSKENLSREIAMNRIRDALSKAGVGR